MKFRYLKPFIIVAFIILLVLCQQLAFKQGSILEIIKDSEIGEGPFAEPNWERIFRSKTPLLEIFIRGTLTYLSLFFLLRVFLKRQSGGLGMTDILVVVLLADAAQNAMADDYHSVTDGVLLVIVIIFWAYFLEMIGFFFPKIQNIINPPEILLIKNGKVIPKNLRKEYITEQELMSQLRENGIDDLQNVREAYMESDGQISVLTYSKEVRKRNKWKG